MGATDTTVGQVHEMSLTYRIVSTTETVTVPAGNYTNCVKVSASGESSGTYDFGFRRLPIRQKINVDSWYAPGVGLVLSTRTEEIVGGGLGIAPWDRSHALSMQLKSFK